MNRLGTMLDGAARRFRTLPAPTRRWLTILSVPALAVGLLVGTLLGPGVLGATGLPTVITMPFASDSGGDGSAPEVVAGTGGGAGADAGPPVLGAPSGNVPTPTSTPAPPPAPAPAPAFPAPATPPASTPPPLDQGPTPDPGPQSNPPPSDPTTGGGQGPPTEKGPTLTGTVVRVNPVAHSYALADGEATLVAIHAPHLPEVGRKVSVEGRQLSNGTYAEEGSRKPTGRSSKAGFSGTVTYSDPDTGVYTVSSRGASVLVHLPSDSAPSAAPPPAAPGASFLFRALAAAVAPGPPPVGSQVTVTVSINPAPTAVAEAPPEGAPPPAPPVGDQAEVPVPAPALAPPLCQKPADAVAPDPPPEPSFTLVERKRKVGDDLLGYSDFEGVVQAVCASPSQLVLSADDVREAGIDLRITIPKTLDLSNVASGAAVDATTRIDEKTGALELAGLSSDQGAAGANEAKAALGDQAGG